MVLEMVLFGINSLYVKMDFYIYSIVCSFNVHTKQLSTNLPEIWNF